MHLHLIEAAYRPRARLPRQIDLSLSWYVITTRVAWEPRVATDLVLSAGLQVYLPTEIRVRHAKSRRREVEKPAFPRYLFVGLPPALPGAFGLIAGVEGFERFLGPPEAPQPLRQPALLQEIEDMLCEGGDPRVIKRKKRGKLEELAAMLAEMEAERLSEAA